MTTFIQYAGFRRRLLATLIDLLLCGIFTETLLVLSNGPAYFYEPEYLQNLIHSVSGTRHAASTQSIFIQLLPIIITIIVWVKYMGTPGKLLMNSIVVDAKTLQPITLRQAMVRYFGYLVSVLPFGLGILWIIWDPRGQAFHDKLADTLVILEDEADKTLSQQFRSLGK